MRFLSLPSIVLFLVILLGVTWRSKAMTTTDVDLGISTSKLSLFDNLLWSLPFAIFLWLLAITTVKTLALLAKRQRWRRAAGVLDDGKNRTE